MNPIYPVYGYPIASAEALKTRQFMNNPQKSLIPQQMLIAPNPPIIPTNQLDPNYYSYPYYPIPTNSFNQINHNDKNLLNYQPNYNQYPISPYPYHQNSPPGNKQPIRENYSIVSRKKSKKVRQSNPIDNLIN